MIAFSHADHQRERYIFGGWNIADDDTSKPPEVSPLDSAQSRRAARLDRCPPGVETIFTPMNMRVHSTGILQPAPGLKSIKPLALQAITASRNPSPFNTV